MNWLKIDSKNETSRQEHTHTKIKNNLCKETTKARRLNQKYFRETTK